MQTYTYRPTGPVCSRGISFAIDDGRLRDVRFVGGCDGNLKAIGKLVEGGHAVKGLTKRIFQFPAEEAEHIPPGHGGVVDLNGEKAGVFRDADGTLHTVDLKCRHLGCQLEWNPDELTWDCPCHGSRYDRYGHLISGPAQEDITAEE